MAIEVKALNDVWVDGQAAGAVTDVLSNYKGRVKETFDALVAWKASNDADHTAAIAAQADAHAAALAAKDAQVAALAAERDALGGTELAQQLEKQQRQAAAEAKLAEAQAELAALASIVASGKAEPEPTDLATTLGVG